MTLFLAQARRNSSNNLLSLFIKSLPDKVEIPFQYKIEEIETYPTEVRVLSLQLKENLDYLENMTCDCFDIKRTEFDNDIKSIQIYFKPNTNLLKRYLISVYFCLNSERDDLEWAYSIVLSRSFSAPIRRDQEIKFPDFLAEDYSINAFLCPFIGSRFKKSMFETEIH